MVKGSKETARTQMRPRRRKGRKLNSSSFILFPSNQNDLKLLLRVLNDGFPSHSNPRKPQASIPFTSDKQRDFTRDRTTEGRRSVELDSPSLPSLATLLSYYFS